MSNFGINVFDFGAKGDGITDDTAAIQAAINYTAERGGGKILFPYTKGGYRIASPAIRAILNILFFVCFYKTIFLS